MRTGNPQVQSAWDRNFLFGTKKVQEWKASPRVNGSCFLKEELNSWQTWPHYTQEGNQSNLNLKWSKKHQSPKSWNIPLGKRLQEYPMAGQLQHKRLRQPHPQNGSMAEHSLGIVSHYKSKRLRQPHPQNGSTAEQIPHKKGPSQDMAFGNFSHGKQRLQTLQNVLHPPCFPAAAVNKLWQPAIGSEQPLNGQMSPGMHIFSNSSTNMLQAEGLEDPFYQRLRKRWTWWQQNTTNPQVLN